MNQAHPQVMILLISGNFVPLSDSNTQLELCKIQGCKYHMFSYSHWNIYMALSHSKHIEIIFFHRILSDYYYDESVETSDSLMTSSLYFLKCCVASNVFLYLVVILGAWIFHYNRIDQSCSLKPTFSVVQHQILRYL